MPTPIDKPAPKGVREFLTRLKVPQRRHPAGTLSSLQNIVACRHVAFFIRDDSLRS